MNIAIFGSGYVGLVTGVCLATLGHDVRCVDVDPARVDAIRRGVVPFEEPELAAMLDDALRSGAFSMTLDPREALAGADVSFIAVGTPSLPDGSIDLRFVRDAAAAAGRVLRSRSDYHVVVVKSTVVPGTTGTIVREIVARESGREDFGLCMNPEFLREGSAVADFMNPDRIVIGSGDERAAAVVRRLYDRFDCPVVATSLENAEMIKYASNALLALLISYSNEIASVCEGVSGADADVVMNGVHLDRRLRNAPINAYLRAGIGFGGSCLPKDVKALRAFASSRGIATPMIDATLAVNEARARRVAEILRGELGALAGRRAGVLGLAFKPGTDDVRDSPSLPLLRSLAAEGCELRVYDPAVHDSATVPAGTLLCRSAEELFAGSDAIVLATAWPEFAAWDWTSLTRTMRTKLVVDGRNSLRGVQLPRDVTYQPIGRARG